MVVEVVGKEVGKGEGKGRDMGAGNIHRKVREGAGMEGQVGTWGEGCWGGVWGQISSHCRLGMGKWEVMELVGNMVLCRALNQEKEGRWKKKTCIRHTQCKKSGANQSSIIFCLH